MSHDATSSSPVVVDAKALFVKVTKLKQDPTATWR